MWKAFPVLRYAATLVYTQPYDPKRPQVGMNVAGYRNTDETSKQLLDDVQAPLPAQPGQVERVDYE